MTKEKIISVGSFVKILDLKHPKHKSVGVYGEVSEIEKQKVSLKVSPGLGFGTIIERTFLDLELSDISSIPLAQVQGLGYSLQSVLPQELLM